MKSKKESERRLVMRMQEGMEMFAMTGWKEQQERYLKEGRKEKGGGRNYKASKRRQ